MAETEQTRITRFGGNPTTYNNNSARILKGRDVMVLRPEGGIEHRMYDDGTMTRVDDRTGESIPVPAEYDAYWRDAFEQAQTNARPNLLQRGVHWVGRGIEKAGNWLQRFENGGTAQQPESNKQKRMKELLLIINGAAKELSTKQPGDNVAYLAQVIQDPQEAELIDAIIAEIPDAQEVIDQVSLLSSQMFKCGGKTKKKVKKGAKGCVPCKKLMRVGGKLVNVWSDCEGNIISKHQVGGYLIPKGLVGLTAQFVQEPYRKAKAITDTGKNGDVHYYLGDDGKTIFSQTYNGEEWTQGTLADMAAFKNWTTLMDNSGQILGKNFFVQGFNYDYDTGMGTMSKEDAAAAGIDGSKYDTAGKEVNGVMGQGGNDLYGIEAKDPTHKDAFDLIGYNGIMRNINRDLAVNTYAAKQDFKSQRRSILKTPKLWGTGLLKSFRTIKNNKILEAKNNAVLETKNWNLEWMKQNNKYLTNVKPLSKDNLTVNVNKGDNGASSSSGFLFKKFAQVEKQGGWLTKFN